MSHTLQVSIPPQGFNILATTAHCDCAAFENRERRFYGLQFHPEVTHTPRGKEIFKNFLFNICGCSGDWQMKSYADEAIACLLYTSSKSRSGGAAKRINSLAVSAPYLLMISSGLTTFPFDLLILEPSLSTMP